MKQILLVEDDEMLNSGVCYHLENAGYAVAPVFTYAEARKRIFDDGLQLCVVDINLPDGNGIELCREISSRTHIPAIILTANDLEADVLDGFDAGAADYITKPFSIPILIKRVAAVLKRNAAGPKTVVHCGNLMVDFEKGQLLKSGDILRLTQNEWKLITLFLSNQGQLLTRKQILQILWDNAGNFVDEHTLTTLVSRLRSKLSDSEYSYIKTCYGMGYRWVGESNEE